MIGDSAPEKYPRHSYGGSEPLTMNDIRSFLDDVMLTYDSEGPEFTARTCDSAVQVLTLAIDRNDRIELVKWHDEFVPS